MLFLSNFTRKEVETIRDVAKASMSRVKKSCSKYCPKCDFYILKILCDEICVPKYTVLFPEPFISCV